MSEKRKKVIGRIRIVMGFIGMFLSWAGINEHGDDIIWPLLITGYLFATPIYIYGIKQIIKSLK